MKKRFYHYLVLSILTASFVFADSSLAYSQTFEYSMSQPIHYALPAGDETVSPCSNDIQWRYKFIDGILYKRKYNYTTKTWIGNWERAY